MIYTRLSHQPLIDYMDVNAKSHDNGIRILILRFAEGGCLSLLEVRLSNEFVLRSSTAAPYSVLRIT